MKLKNKYKFIIIGLIIYCLIMAVVVIKIFNRDSGYTTVFIDNFSKWIFVEGEWVKIPKEDIKNYTWKKYDLYYDQQKMGNYYLANTNDKWYIFDDNKISVNWKMGIIALGGDRKSTIDNMDISQIESDEYDFVETALKSIDVDDVDLDKVAFKQKYRVDLDHDGKKENIYAVSNAQMQGEYPQDKTYTAIFARNKNRSTIIYKLVLDKSNAFAGCIPTIYSLNIDRLKTSKIMVSCAFYSAKNVYTFLYDYDSKKQDFKNLIMDFGINK